MSVDNVKYKIGGKGPAGHTILMTMTGLDSEEQFKGKQPAVRLLTKFTPARDGGEPRMRGTVQRKRYGSWGSRGNDIMATDTLTPVALDNFFRLFSKEAEELGFRPGAALEARKRVDKKLASGTVGTGSGALSTVEVPSTLTLVHKGKRSVFVDYGLKDSGIALVKRGDPSSAVGRADATVISRVPIDARGNIKKEAAQVHFLNDLGMSSNAHSERKPAIDVKIQAQQVAPLKSSEKSLENKRADMLEQWEWWFAPNEGDIKNMDTKGVAGELGPRIIVVGSTLAQKNVIEILKRNFTAKERKLMQDKGLIIEVGTKLRAGIAGVYMNDSGPGNFDLIRVGSDRLLQRTDFAVPAGGPNKGETLDDNTLTHELIHFLRNRDPRRDAITRKAADFNTPKDRDLEETFTDAETTARISTGIERKGTDAGYYPRVPTSKLPEGVADREAAAVHDKMLLMGNSVDRKGKTPTGNPTSVQLSLARQRRVGMTKTERADAIAMAKFPTFREGDRAIDNAWKGKKGIAAVQATNKAFPNTVIAKAGIHTKDEAVDTYWKYKTDLGKGQKLTVYTHMYSPKGNIDMVKARAVAKMGAPGGELVRFEDGKEVVLSGKSKRASMGRRKRKI